MPTLNFQLQTVMCRASLLMLVALVTGSCAHTNAGRMEMSSTAKESDPMNVSITDNSGQDIPPVQPKLTAEQVLTRLLELIRTTKSIEDFTPEHLSNVIGVEFKNISPGYYGFGEQITAAWFYGMELNEGSSTGRSRFYFSFNSNPATSPDMTSICQVDFDQFTTALEKMGFKRQRSFGEHGRFMSDLFDRHGMHIEVSPRGEAMEPIDRISHFCVKTILIQ
jgi:hypothetical protein